MEVPFYNFPDFFHGPGQEEEGGGGQPEQPGGEAGRQAGEQQHRRAQEPEIDAAPQQEGGDCIEPQLPAPPEDGIEEEPHSGQDPEEQVQGRAQEGQADPPPEGAHQVVGHAQPGPQQHRPQEGPGLVQQVDLHYRNSRARKPPRSPPASS